MGFILLLTVIFFILMFLNDLGKIHFLNQEKYSMIIGTLSVINFVFMLFIEEK
jgi:hypothetical protein